MRRHLVLVVFLSALAPAGARAEQASWIFLPSQYSHSPVTGQQVAQYCPEKPAYARIDDTYMESGYRHNQMTIQVGNRADHLHVVQTWGQGDLIRPYGEWQFPFRAGATPYGPWGNPQGPWTTPFDSWQNPYGLGRFSYPYGPAVGGGLPPGGAWPRNAPPGPGPARGPNTTGPAASAVPPPPGIDPPAL